MATRQDFETLNRLMESVERLRDRVEALAHENQHLKRQLDNTRQENQHV